tara:strand:- start:377 stop:1036 length:660 start_codon:yes stop_codon:yes gene_type:complete
MMDNCQLDNFNQRYIKYNKTKRCQCKNSINNLVCLNKNKTLYLYNNKLYCKFHYYYYKNIQYKVLIIQKIFRGYRHRCIINKIYNKLPDDIQYKILYFIRREIYRLRYLKKIRNIVKNKILDTIKDITVSRCNNITLGDYILINSDKIIYICKLVNKYNILIDLDLKYPMYDIVKTIENIVSGTEYANNMYYSADENLIKKLYNIYIESSWLIKKPSRR